MRMRRVVLFTFLLCFLLGTLSNASANDNSVKVIVDGKVVVTTNSVTKVKSAIKDNIGKPLVILPEDYPKGVWEKVDSPKGSKGRPVSVIVNGCKVLETKNIGLVSTLAQKSLGKRIMIVPEGVEVPSYYPEKINVVLKGPFKKELLDDSMGIYLKLCPPPTPDKILKRWKEGDKRFIKFKGGTILSTETESIEDNVVEMVFELKKEEQLIIIDRLKQQPAQMMKLMGFLGGIEIVTEDSVEGYVINYKAEDELFRQVYKAL